MTEKEDILKNNFKEYFDQAKESFNKENYNVATTLFFKAICAGADLYILKQTGEVPSSHTKRFRVAQESFPKLYRILDKDFPFYQDSYTKKMDKEAAEVMKEDAERIKEICNI